MIAFYHFNLGANGSTWYGWMFLGLACVIIFPDEMLDSLNLTFDWRHLVWLEVIFIGIIIASTIILKRHYPALRWYLPLVAIGFAALIRGIWSYFSR